MDRPSALDDLVARVAGADGWSRHPHAAAVALATLDPAGAAAWLLAHRGDEAAAVPRPVVAGMVARLIEALADAPEAIPRSDVLGLLTHYGHVLPPDHVVDLATAARSAGGDSDLTHALETALERAPTHRGLLRASAEVSATAPDAARAHDLLTRLARAEPGLATAQLVRRARARLPATGDPPVRIALLSSFTIDPVIPCLDVECRGLGLEPNVYLAPFNSWEREVFGEGAGLADFAPEIAFLAVAADDVIPGLAAGAPPTELEQQGARAVERVLAAAERFVSWSPAALVVHSLYTVHVDPLGPAASRDDGPTRAEVLGALNVALAAGLRKLPRAYLLDMTDVLLHRRTGPLDNPKMRHLARMRLNEHVLVDLARAYARFVAPIKGRTRKCIVLDLDNTLWGGIVGEDGPHGIKLGDTSPGSEYREFQQYLQALTGRGMLLAVNSKNNADDALEVIRSHDAMVLREQAFSAMRINWENKPANMLSLAEELSIGVDSFVFVDDSEKERALMRQALPQVLTPEMPRDPARYRQTLEDLPELHALAVTAEDKTRTRQYAERRQREQLRVSSQTLDDYLASLGIAVAIDLVRESTLPRVHQLFQRTNQFNLTGRRYELGDLSTRAADAAWRVYTARVGDRFGDHGLVATALVDCGSPAWRVENFVMSCRVISYGVEDALLARIGADARRAGAERLIGEFRSTPKNAPARGFYERNTFARASQADAETECWERNLTGDAMTAPSWIHVTHADGT